MTARSAMLSSVCLFLRAEESRPLPESQGRALHALFLDILELVDAELAKTLHDADDLKPFALSALRYKPSRTEDGELFLKEGTGLTWRICGLSETVVMTLLEGLARWKLSRRPFGIGEARFEIRRIASSADEAIRWAATTTTAQLFAAAGREREVTLEFLSPTSFRRQGKQMLFPEPSVVFGSLARKWEAVTGEPPPAEILSPLLSSLFVARYDLRTRLIPFERYKIAGFVGKITFELPKAAPADQVKWLNALADFAFFSGTGYKTTMGLGETRRSAG